MPMHRWIIRAAGGTSHLLKPGPAMILSLSRKPVDIRSPKCCYAARGGSCTAVPQRTGAKPRDYPTTNTKPSNDLCERSHSQRESWLGQTLERALANPTCRSANAALGLRV